MARACRSLIGRGRACRDLQLVGRARRTRLAPLRQLHLHLKEPVRGVGWRLPHRIRQILLAHDRIHPHLAVGVKVG